MRQIIGRRRRISIKKTFLGRVNTPPRDMAPGGQMCNKPVKSSLSSTLEHWFSWRRDTSFLLPPPPPWLTHWLVLLAQCVLKEEWGPPSLSALIAGEVLLTVVERGGRYSPRRTV